MELHEVKVRYLSTLSGKVEKLNATFLVEAVTFGHSEEEVMKRLSDSAYSDIAITSIKKVGFNEVLFTDDKQGGWFGVKVLLGTMDESTGREKKITISNLVQAADIEQAHSRADEDMRKNTIVDYTIKEIRETDIVEVITD